MIDVRDPPSHSIRQQHWFMARARLIIDASMLIRSGMPATGISRVSYELSRWALWNRPETHLVAVDWVYDVGKLRVLHADIAREVVEKTTVVNTFLVPDKARIDKMRLREHLPIPLRYVLMSLQHPRRAAIMHLEYWRQHTRSTSIAAILRSLVGRLTTENYRRLFATSTGRSVRLVSYREALLAFDARPGDILLLAGAEWGWIDPSFYEELKANHGVRIVWMCYDIIPLLHPEFFQKRLASNFRNYAHSLFATADLVLVSARQIENDLTGYCRKHGLRVPPTRVIPYGANLTQVTAAPPRPLPRGLKPGQYAMFVSTIEPRKGHRMLASVWKRLLTDGVPQAADFSLVFVGRPGWMVDDLMTELKAFDGEANRFHLLSGIGDEDLDTLYRNAGFCIYPSVYEGYGLPIVEAFGYGKAVLASNGGALKEVVADFSPTLDPLDENAWYLAMKRWIENAGERAPYEQAIRERYRHPTWDEAAGTCISIVEDALQPR